MPASLDSLRVLLVEGHPFQRAMAEQLLRQLGIVEIHGVADGRQAEAALREQTFDLVL